MIKFMNPLSCLKSSKMNSLKKRMQNNTAMDITQEQAQQVFEKQEFDPSFAYAAVANTVFTAFFFQPILPLGSASALVGLVLTYYAYKKMLLRDSKRPVMVSDDIAEVTLYLLNAAPFVYGVVPCYLALVCHIRQDSPRQGRVSVCHHAHPGNLQYLLSFLLAFPEHLQGLLQQRPENPGAELHRTIRRHEDAILERVRPSESYHV
jgi:hypothetical protein